MPKLLQNVQRDKTTIFSKIVKIIFGYFQKGGLKRGTTKKFAPHRTQMLSPPKILRGGARKTCVFMLKQ